MPGDHETPAIAAGLAPSRAPSRARASRATEPPVVASHTYTAPSAEPANSSKAKESARKKAEKRRRQAARRAAQQQQQERSYPAVVATAQFDDAASSDEEDAATEAEDGSETERSAALAIRGIVSDETIGLLRERRTLYEQDFKQFGEEGVILRDASLTPVANDHLQPRAGDGFV